MAEKFDTTVEALIKGLEGYASTKTILGEPMRFNDMIILPMAEVSMGVVAGSFNNEKKNNGTGGAGMKVTPSALLVIQNGTSKVVNIKDTDSINKLIDIIPDLINKLTGRPTLKDQVSDIEIAPEEFDAK